MELDVFNYLANAGTHPISLLLILGPLAFFFVFFAVFFVFVRNRTEKKDRELKASFQEIVGEEIPKGIDVARQSAPVPVTSLSKKDKFLNGLERTRKLMTQSILEVFGKGETIGPDILEKLHETLFRADLGVRVADDLTRVLNAQLKGKVDSWDQIRPVLRETMLGYFNRNQTPAYSADQHPIVILVVGVNGVGKTTTIGKLASLYKQQGKSVLLGAADTFRAAAVEQLIVWGERNDVGVIRQNQGADPAAVAFDSVHAAKSRNIDVLLIDTAGRLQSKAQLMDELAKINRSIGKGLPGAPHETWLVLDATTGQNAIQQCKSFSEVTNLTGIIVTKLDGTAKGGVILSLVEQFGKQIKYAGIGEKIDDLEVFDPEIFVDSII
jgi:fused signal recognition particle receptor